MALFSSRKPVVFQHSAYGATRRRRGVPRWLMLILTGIALGAGGVLFLQSSYGPPRLTAEESQQLHHDLNAANIEKQRLQAQLDQFSHGQQEAQSNASRFKAELDTARARVAEQQANITALIDSIPADPRGTSPGISSATFRNVEGNLDYQLLIMQDSADKPEFNGKMTLVVEGVYPNGRVVTINLDPIPFTVGHYGFVRGQVPLPNGMRARLVTARITEGEDTRLRATRTLRVR